MAKQSFRDYYEAEDTADQVAEAQGVKHAVVERFTETMDPFIVMPFTEAEEYIDEYDAEIQYETGPYDGPYTR